MTLFSGYVAVDWSASGRPRRGADSIWIAVGGPGVRPRLSNPATRAAAAAELREIFAEARLRGTRLLAGFDFPFGYPEGTAERLTGRADWAALWARIAGVIEDAPDNATNRFDAAAALNAAWQAEGPFWGNGLARDIAGLPRRKPTGWGSDLPPNNRHAEAQVPGAQEVWKLGGAGSVGSQALTGIAVLERLRRDAGARVWPFETLGEGTSHVFAEIYPSLIPPVPGPEPKDARQVMAVARALEALDRRGEMKTFLRAPETMPEAVRREEALIFGMHDPEAFRAAARDAYLRAPGGIYAESLRIIQAELATLGHTAPDPIAVRMIHACGMPDLIGDLRISPGALDAGRTALDSGAAILCDAEMVARGIIARSLPPGSKPLVTLNDPCVPGIAESLGTTRSAAAVELWADSLEGAVVAIGNAPTALFHLLDGLSRGWPRPALIIGVPVGFVGAAEAKAALAEASLGIPFVTVLGRRGGSAMAAAAVNALTLGAGGDGT